MIPMEVDLRCHLWQSAIQTQKRRETSCYDIHFILGDTYETISTYHL